MGSTPQRRACVHRYCWSIHTMGAWRGSVQKDLDWRICPLGMTSYSGCVWLN